MLTWPGMTACGGLGAGRPRQHRRSPPLDSIIPIVTTASTVDAVELAQTYTQRWTAQENIIRDFLLPLGLEIVCSQMTKTGVFATRRSRDHVADLDLFSRDDHSINEEFYELPFLFEAGLLESLTHSLTKR